MIERDNSGYRFREREIIVVKGSDRQMGRERERESRGQGFQEIERMRFWVRVLYREILGARV